MSLLTNALDEILGYLERLKPEYAEALQPGLSYDEIDQELNHLPFRLPQEIYTLYQWRNGMYQENYFYGDSLFSPHFTIDPLGQALTRYREKLEYWETSWNHMWFPFLYCGPKSYFFIVGSVERHESSPVFYGDIEFPKPTLRYSSLTEMMLQIAENYRTGFYFVDENSGELSDEDS